MFHKLCSWIRQWVKVLLITSIQETIFLSTTTETSEKPYPSALAGETLQADCASFPAADTIITPCAQVKITSTWYRVDSKTVFCTNSLFQMQPQWPHLLLLRHLHQGISYKSKALTIQWGYSSDIGMLASTYLATDFFLSVCWSATQLIPAITPLHICKQYQTNLKYASLPPIPPSLSMAMAPSSFPHFS